PRISTLSLRDALPISATPTDYIDHNTFQLFSCDDGVPTYLYSYEQAVADGNLVNYRVLDAQTQFQIQGIQGDSLPEPLQQMAREDRKSTRLNSSHVKI